MLIEIDKDAALVLLELIASRQEEIVMSLGLGAAERNALWVLEGALEGTLVEVFDSQHAELVQAARHSLIKRLGD